MYFVQAHQFHILLHPNLFCHYSLTHTHWILLVVLSQLFSLHYEFSHINLLKFFALLSPTHTHTHKTHHFWISLLMRTQYWLLIITPIVSHHSSTSGQFDLTKSWYLLNKNLYQFIKIKLRIKWMKKLQHIAVSKWNIGSRKFLGSFGI